MEPAISCTSSGAAETAFLYNKQNSLGIFQPASQFTGTAARCSDLENCPAQEQQNDGKNDARGVHRRLKRRKPATDQQHQGNDRQEGNQENRIVNIEGERTDLPLDIVLRHLVAGNDRFDLAFGRGNVPFLGRRIRQGLCLLSLDNTDSQNNRAARHFKSAVAA